MLIAAATVVENAIAHKSVLQAKRPAWQDPFFENLKANIEGITNDYLGIDNARKLRTATINLRSIQQQAAADLTALKVQIQEDFKNEKIRRNELLNRLGFAAYGRGINTGNQEVLVNLLYQLKLNLDTNMHNSIVAKGIDEALLDRIIGYANLLREAEVGQESEKSERPLLTIDTIAKLNEVYDQAMSICRIGTKFMNELPAGRNLFNFSKIIRNMGVKLHPPSNEGNKPNVTQ